MKKYYIISKSSILVLILLVMQLFLVGCQQKATTQDDRVIFYPPAPEKARLQFLKSFTAIEDLGGEGPSSFENFMWGSPERRDMILKPYGIAMYDGKLYVCDVGRAAIEVFDIRNSKFYLLSQERRMKTPMNIFIDNGIKYVADPKAGSIFVFDKDDDLTKILASTMDVTPVDVYVKGNRCYFTDSKNNSVIVLDTETEKEIMRFGTSGAGLGQFQLISDLTMDKKGNIFVTDKMAARITEFDSEGIFIRTMGTLGSNIHELVRPKGIAIDHNDNIWLVDASTEIAKIYNTKEQLLLLFGGAGSAPGSTNLPAKLILDYDNVDLFTEYAVDGAKLEFLVITTNQLGKDKVNVYGFGTFPDPVK